MEELILDMNKRYSYADYLTWMDGVRRELFDGYIRVMNFPVVDKRKSDSEIISALNNTLKNAICQTYVEPFEIFLSNNFEGKVITPISIKPSLSVFYKNVKIQNNSYSGAPDMIIEIVSPSKAKYVVETKFQLYQNNGVREYWIVFPYESTILVYLLDDNGKYQQKGIFADDDKIPVNIFNGDLVVDLTEVFE